MLNVCQKAVLKLFIVVVVSSSLPGNIWADNISNDPAATHDMDEYLIIATDEELAQQRGGFVLPNGVTLDISLERIIFLNGIETSSSLMQFSDNNTLLLQNGNENLAPDSIGSTIATVIQNSLDDQIIKALNEINIEISNLQDIGLSPNNHHTSFDSILPVLQ